MARPEQTSMRRELVGSVVRKAIRETGYPTSTAASVGISGSEAHVEMFGQLDRGEVAFKKGGVLELTPKAPEYKGPRTPLSAREIKDSIIDSALQKFKEAGEDLPPELSQSKPQRR